VKYKIEIWTKFLCDPLTDYFAKIIAIFSAKNIRAGAPAAWNEKRLSMATFQKI